MKPKYLQSSGLFSSGLNPEETTLVREYAEIARIHYNGLPGAWGIQLNRTRVAKYCEKYLVEKGQLPVGQHRVPCHLSKDTNYTFPARFPDEELAGAVMLVLLAGRCPLHGLLGTRLVKDLIPEWTVDALRVAVISQKWAGLGSATGRNGEWVFLPPSTDEKGKHLLPQVGHHISELNRLVTILGAATVQAGTYVPTMHHTDDYTSAKMQFDFGVYRVVVGSRSQGRYHVPWYVDTGQQQYVINSAVPAFAFETIRCWLKLPHLLPLPD